MRAGKPFPAARGRFSFSNERYAPFASRAGCRTGEAFRHIHSKRDGRFARGPPDGKSAVRTVLHLRPPFASQAASPDGRRRGIHTVLPFADRFRAGL